MGVEKRFKRTEITYQERLEDSKDLFVVNHNYYNWSYDDAEDYQVDQCGYTFAEYEIDRMLTFVGMAYLEVIGDGLTDRLKGELELDLPVWESGVVDEYLMDEEKDLVYEHLNVIKEYINSRKADQLN